MEQTQENVKDVIASPGARFEGSVHISEEVIVELTRKTIQGIPNIQTTNTGIASKFGLGRKAGEGGSGSPSKRGRSHPYPSRPTFWSNTGSVFPTWPGTSRRRSRPTWSVIRATPSVPSISTSREFMRTSLSFPRKRRTRRFRPPPMRSPGRKRLRRRAIRKRKGRFRGGLCRARCAVTSVLS